MEEKKKEQKVEISYEVKMYQLLILFMVSIFVAIGLGLWLGNSTGYTIGYSEGVDAVTIETPDYCYAENEGREQVTIVCTELENVTVKDLCDTLSKPLEHAVKILITG